MNYWTRLSVEYAQQRSYLDDLFRVYPLAPEGVRELDQAKWAMIERAFEARRNSDLINSLLELPAFPLKDSYVAYFRRDRAAIARNPKTVDRLCGMLYQMGLGEMFARCSAPKETNRQIGPLFRRWVQSGVLGALVLPMQEFDNGTENAVLDGTDAQITEYARARLGYNGDKGIDFLGRFNSRMVVGEAKFVSDYGGNQDKSLLDASALLRNQSIQATKVAIMDGVLYIPSKGRMHRFLHDNPDLNIMSSLLLREFLYSL